MPGFETILPFLKPIEHLILDDSISEVMVNGPDQVLSRKPASSSRFVAFHSASVRFSLQLRTLRDGSVTISRKQSPFWIHDYRTAVASPP